MEINTANLQGLTASIKMSFQGGLTAPVGLSWEKVATKISSVTSVEQFPWFGAFPRFRPWVGSRVIKNIRTHGYSITHDKFEDTIAIGRTAIEDDQYGVFAPVAQAFGQAAAELPDELVYRKLLNGFIENCYDGQFFFDVDHPVIDPATGLSYSVSNMQAGAGNPWFLLDTTRPVKPMILTDRVAPEITARDNPWDPHVFDKDEFIWGARARYGTGFGFWQMAFGSKAPFTEANFNAARLAMEEVKNDEGVKLGIRPNLIVFGSSNEAAIEEVLKKANKTGGESNLNYNRVEMHKVRWLS
jgi:phage major head subunit gpT-like protein